MKFAYVNISDIFRQQQRIIQAGTDNYSHPEFIGKTRRDVVFNRLESSDLT